MLGGSQGVGGATQRGGLWPLTAAAAPLPPPATSFTSDGFSKYGFYSLFPGGPTFGSALYSHSTVGRFAPSIQSSPGPTFHSAHKVSDSLFSTTGYTTTFGSPTPPPGSPYSPLAPPCPTMVSASPLTTAQTTTHHHHHLELLSNNNNNINKGGGGVGGVLNSPNPLAASNTYSSNSTTNSSLILHQNEQQQQIHHHHVQQQQQHQLTMSPKKQQVEGGGKQQLCIVKQTTQQSPSAGAIVTAGGYQQYHSQQHQFGVTKATSVTLGKLSTLTNTPMDLNNHHHQQQQHGTLSTTCVGGGGCSRTNPLDWSTTNGNNGNNNLTVAPAMIKKEPGLTTTTTTTHHHHHQLVLSDHHHHHSLGVGNGGGGGGGGRSAESSAATAAIIKVEMTSPIQKTQACHQQQEMMQQPSIVTTNGNIPVGIAVGRQRIQQEVVPSSIFSTHYKEVARISEIGGGEGNHFHHTGGGLNAATAMGAVPVPLLQHHPGSPINNTALTGGGGCHSTTAAAVAVADMEQRAALAAWAAAVAATTNTTLSGGGNTSIASGGLGAGPGPGSGQSTLWQYPAPFPIEPVMPMSAPVGLQLVRDPTTGALLLLHTTGLEPIQQAVLWPNYTTAPQPSPHLILPPLPPPPPLQLLTSATNSDYLQTSSSSSSSSTSSTTLQHHNTSSSSTSSSSTQHHHHHQTSSSSSSSTTRMVALTSAESGLNMNNMKRKMNAVIKIEAATAQDNSSSSSMITTGQHKTINNHHLYNPLLTTTTHVIYQQHPPGLITVSAASNNNNNLILTQSPPMITTCRSAQTTATLLTGGGAHQPLVAPGLVCLTPPPEAVVTASSVVISEHVDEEELEMLEGAAVMPHQVTQQDASNQTENSLEDLEEMATLEEAEDELVTEREMEFLQPREIKFEQQSQQQLKIEFGNQAQHLLVQLQQPETVLQNSVRHIKSEVQPQECPKLEYQKQLMETKVVRQLIEVPQQVVRSTKQLKTLKKEQPSFRFDTQLIKMDKQQQLGDNKQELKFAEVQHLQLQDIKPVKDVKYKQQRLKLQIQQLKNNQQLLKDSELINVRNCKPVKQRQLKIEQPTVQQLTPEKKHLEILIPIDPSEMLTHKIEQVAVERIQAKKELVEPVINVIEVSRSRKVVKQEHFVVHMPDITGNVDDAHNKIVVEESQVLAAQNPDFSGLKLLSNSILEYESSKHDDSEAIVETGSPNKNNSLVITQNSEFVEEEEPPRVKEQISSDSIMEESPSQEMLPPIVINSTESNNQCNNISGIVAEENFAGLSLLCALAEQRIREDKDSSVKLEKVLKSNKAEVTSDDLVIRNDETILTNGNEERLIIDDTTTRYNETITSSTETLVRIDKEDKLIRNENKLLLLRSEESVIDVGRNEDRLSRYEDKTSEELELSREDMKAMRRRERRKLKAKLRRGEVLQGEPKVKRATRDRERIEEEVEGDDNESSVVEVKCRCKERRESKEKEDGFKSYRRKQQDDDNEPEMKKVLQINTTTCCKNSDECPCIISANERDMRQQLADLQRKYREKQRELSKLKPNRRHHHHHHHHHHGGGERKHRKKSTQSNDGGECCESPQPPVLVEEMESVENRISVKNEEMLLEMKAPTISRMTSTSGKQLVEEELQVEEEEELQLIDEDQQLKKHRRSSCERSKKRKVERPKRIECSSETDTETIVAKKPKKSSNLVGYLLAAKERLLVQNPYSSSTTPPRYIEETTNGVTPQLHQDDKERRSKIRPKLKAETRTISEEFEDERTSHKQDCYDSEEKRHDGAVDRDKKVQEQQEGDPGKNEEEEQKKMLEEDRIVEEKDKIVEEEDKIVEKEEVVKDTRCVLTTELLDNEKLRVLTAMGGLFYAGNLNAVQPPDVYSITLDGERGNRPHIMSREEILRDAIVEISPTNIEELTPGTRLCAYWSQQYRCLYPGSVAEPADMPSIVDNEKKFVAVEFDDGDNGTIALEDIRLLPVDYPIIEYDPNPLLSLSKRRRRLSTTEERKTTSATTKTIAVATPNTSTNVESLIPTTEKENLDTNSITTKATQRESKKRLKKRKRERTREKQLLDGNEYSSSNNSRRKKKKHKCTGDLCKHRRHHKKHKKHHRKRHHHKTAKTIKEEPTTTIVTEEKQQQKSVTMKSQQTITNEVPTSTEETVLLLSSDLLNLNDETGDDGGINVVPNPEDEVTMDDILEVTAKNKSKKIRDRQESCESSRSKMSAFLPARQLWGWCGKGYKRPRGKGRSKKEFFKSIQRGKETMTVGDSAVFLSTGRPDRPYIGKIEAMWETCGTMVVKVKWFYHPEETVGIPGELKYPGALFESPHVDENDVQTISHKCRVLGLEEYVGRLGSDPGRYARVYDSNDVYYLAGYYDPTVGKLTMNEGIPIVEDK